MVENDKNPIQVADRLFGAVEYLAENGASSLMELANALSLNKSTMHRVLSSLEFMGYVTQDAQDGHYKLTFKIMRLAMQHMGQIDILEVVIPYLRKLMRETGETVHFVRREGMDAVYIHKVESNKNSIQMVSRIGYHIPLYRSGVGKAILATFGDSKIRKIWDKSEIVAMTPYTITEWDAFMAEIQAIRERGYALDNEENETGVRCIAVALELPDEMEEYALSISAPIGRMTDERIKELEGMILKVKEEINKEFE